MRDSMSSEATRSPTDAARPMETSLALAADPPRPVVARAMLVGLAAVLPFEVPLVTLGPVTLTSVEVAIYAFLGVWGLERVARALRAGRPGRARPPLGEAGRLPLDLRDPVVLATAIWFVVMIISALRAPAHAGAAVKFTLRALGGGLLFFAARDVLTAAPSSSRVVMWVSFGLVVGAALSAGGAVLESAFPQTASIWHSFRTTTFTVTGLPRPSGPFGYPTIAAMYWEAVLPLAVVLPLAGGVAGVAGAVGLAALLIVAILFSATRTALVVATLASLALCLLTWRDRRAARGDDSNTSAAGVEAHQGSPGLRAPPGLRRIRVATGSTMVLVTLLAGLTLAGPSGASPLGTRLRWWEDGNWYLARYRVEDRPLMMDARSMNQVPVTIENAGALTWPHLGADSVRLSYHWEKTDARGAHLDFEGRRSPLPIDLAPGQSVRVLGTVKAPDEPGRYRLRWDLVREHVTWFSERGNATGDQTVDVQAALPGKHPRGDTEMVDSTLEDYVMTYSPTRTELWQAALRVWRRHPLLGVGPDNFRHVYSEALAPGRRLAPGAEIDERIHANSLYFETLADLGVLGVLALLLVMVALARAARRSLSAQAEPLAAAQVIALGTFFVHGLLDWFLEFTPTYALCSLLMALVAVSGGAPAMKKQGTVPPA